MPIDRRAFLARSGSCAAHLALAASCMPPLARAAWGGFIRAAKDIADNGRFDAFADLPVMGDITSAFAHKG